MPMKPADFYGQIAALKAKVPPTSSQAQYYTDIATMVLLILADADVQALGLVAPTGGGPVTGLAKLT